MSAKVRGAIGLRSALCMAQARSAQFDPIR